MTTKSVSHSVNYNLVCQGYRSYTTPTVTSLKGHLNFNNVATYGTNFPDFRLRMLKHTDATTTLVAGKRVISGNTVDAFFSRTLNDGPPGNEKYTKYHTYTGNELVYRIGNLPDPGSPVASQATMSKVHAKFIQRIYSARQRCQSGTILGELQETIHMIRNPALAFRQGLSSYLSSVQKIANAPLRVGKLSRRKTRAMLESEAKKSRMRAVKDSWLEYVFGWRPLISDAKAAAEALAENVELIRSDYEKHSVKLFEDLSPTVSADEAFGTALTSPFTYTVKTYERQKGVSYLVRGQIATGVTEPMTFRRNLFGFNLENFAPTVWELIPWSFAIDYFSNVSDVINSLSYPSASVKWLNGTHRYSCFTVKAGIAGPPPLVAGETLVSYRFNLPSVSYLTTTVNRAAIAPWGLVVFIDLGLPSFRQAINLEALRGQHNRVASKLRL